MRRLLAFVLHATATGIMVWGYVGAIRQPFMRELVSTQKCGHSMFFTYHGLVSASLYMVVSLICDVFPSVAGECRYRQNQSMTVVGHIKKTLLMVSMLIAIVVSGGYSSLVLAFPPPTPVPSPPLMVDLAAHASPFFTLMIDFYVFESKFSKSYARRGALVAIFAIAASYDSFMEYCATFNGFFPYPFLTHSPFSFRILIYITAAGFGLGCFRMLNALHS